MITITNSSGTFALRRAPRPAVLHDLRSWRTRLAELKESRRNRCWNDRRGQSVCRPAMPASRIITPSFLIGPAQRQYRRVDPRDLAHGPQHEERRQCRRDDESSAILFTDTAQRAAIVHGTRQPRRA